MSMIDPALFPGSDYTLDHDKVPRLDRDRQRFLFYLFTIDRFHYALFSSAFIHLQCSFGECFTLQLGDNLFD